MRCRLIDVADLIAGYAFKSKDFGDRFHEKVIKITNITPPCVDMDNLVSVDMAKYNIDKLRKYVAKQGDFVLAMTGATIGKIGRIENGEAYINQRVLMFKPKNIINKNYLYYVIQQEDFYKYIKNHIDSESAQPNISAGTIGKYEIILPKMDVQIRVGDFLRSLDAKIEINNKIIKKIHECFQYIYEYSFLKIGLSGWPIVPMTDLIDYQEGPGIRNWQYVENDGVKFINIRCIVDGDIKIESANMISELEAFGKYSHFLLKPYDIVMSCSGTLGRYAIVRQDHLPLCLNTSVIRFKPKLDFNDFSFVYGFLTSKDFLHQQSILANGSAQVNFGPTHIKRMQMICPPISKRYEFHKLTMPLIESMIMMRSQNLKLMHLRDSLLPKLMTGEINVSNIAI